MTKINGRNYPVAKLKIGDLYCRRNPNTENGYLAQKYLVIDINKNRNAGYLHFTVWNITAGNKDFFTCIPGENLSFFLISRPSENP